jgi:hypothetical protein
MNGSRERERERKKILEIIKQKSALVRIEGKPNEIA